MKSLVLSALLVLGCAAGTATLHADGSCEVRGIAIGRAEIAAYHGDSQAMEAETADTWTRSAREICAKVGGGDGSPSWYGFLGALIGALAAFAPLMF